MNRKMKIVGVTPVINEVDAGGYQILLGGTRKSERISNSTLEVIFHFHKEVSVYSLERDGIDRPAVTLNSGLKGNV
jgi:hypothetical protein